MQHKELISTRQLAWLVCIILLGGGLLSLQRDLVRIANRDASFSYLLPLLYAFGIAMLFTYLTKKFPGKNIFEINHKLAGDWLGGILNGAITVHILLIVITDISIVTNFVNITLIQRTPPEIIMLLLTLLLLYYGTLHIEAASRAVDVIFPVFLISLILLPLLLANEIQLAHLQPLLTDHPLRLWYSNILNLGWYGEVIIVGSFLHTIVNHDDLQPAIRHGVAISTFFLSMVLLLSITVLGTNISARSIFPEYILIEQINITEFLDRMEVFIFSIWMPLYMIKIAISFIALAHGFRSFLKRPSTNALNKPLMLMVLIFTLYAFDSIIEITSYAVYGSLLTVLLLQMPVLLLITVLALINKTKPQSNFTVSDSSKSTAGSHKWKIYSNFLILLCIGFLMTGMFVALQYPKVTNYVSLGYFICLFLIIFTTYKEIKKPSG